MIKAAYVFGFLATLISVYFWDIKHVLPLFKRQYLKNNNESGKVICSSNVFTKQSVCQVDCSHLPHHFSLVGMKNCHPWLTCDEISSEIHLIKSIGEGFVKRAMLATWRNYEIVLNIEKNKLFKDDFSMNIARHRVLNPSKFISQFIGFCNNTYAVKYYPFKESANVHHILHNLIPEINRINVRFSLCLDYVRILNFLHNHPTGIFVTCDSNSVDKIALQYLLTDDFHLILNDLDSVAINNGSGLICGSRMLYGDLIAPEQMWPYSDKPFDFSKMPPYDEKIDIWRIPDVCEYFLANFSSDPITYSLINVHRKCKFENPKDRPTSAEVLKKYMEIVKEFKFDIV